MNQEATKNNNRKTDRGRIFTQESRLLEAARMVAAQVPRACLVGGFVRDALLGLHPKDADIEVYGMPPESLESLLERLFPNRVNAVGRAFGILKIHLGEGFELDVSIPRRESKTGKGHAGFLVESDPHMTLEEAARRRDFTVNAIAADVATGEIHDPYGGVTDLENGVLRIVDPERFQDDPLRVYRAVQLAARFTFRVEEKTYDLMREMVARGDLQELSRERVTDEMKKLLLLAERPSLGFELARRLGMIEAEYPELQALIGTEQEKEWHPEGDVWAHTLMVVDEVAQIIRQPERGFSEEEKLQVIVGSLCHDLGKPATTKRLEGRIRSRGHEEAGEAPARSLCGRWTFSDAIVAAAVVIAREHLKPGMLYLLAEKDRLTGDQYRNAVRKIARRILPVSWRVLAAAAEADWRGRGLPEIARASYVHGEAFARAARELEAASELKPLLQGRDLMALGVAPGPRMGELIRAVEELRDRGELKTREEALEFVRKKISTSS